MTMPSPDAPLVPDLAPLDVGPEARWRSSGKIMMVIRLLAGRAGGAERLFCDIANLLAGAGYDVTVVCCDSGTEPIQYQLSPKVTRVNLWAKASRNAPWYRAIDAAAAGYGKLGPLDLALAPADWLAKNLYFARRLHAVARDSRPDLILSFMPPANTVSLLAGWLAGSRVVPTNHNVPRHDYDSATRWDQNPIDKRLRKWSLRAATRIHVLFPSFGEWFPAELRDRVVAIPNGFSPSFEGVDAATRSQPRRREVAAVGRLVDAKNFPALIEAWAHVAAKHPDWKCKIYGTGPRPQRKYLRELIEKHRLSDSVLLMGHEPNIKQVYLESEILAHPALFEGFGLTVVEAIACGTPVVAFSDCEGVNQLVRNGENGILVDRAGGPRALADALERLIVDDELRTRLRERAPTTIDEYTPAAFAARWLAFVADVLPESSRA